MKCFRFLCEDFRIFHVLSPGYKEWYRACVLSRDQKGYKVQYVDYGDVQVSDNVQPLLSQFISLPPQAIQCVLASEY